MFLTVCLKSLFFSIFSIPFFCIWFFSFFRMLPFVRKNLFVLFWMYFVSKFESIFFCVMCFVNRSMRFWFVIFILGG